MAKYIVLTLGCLLCAFSLSICDEVPTIAISCGDTPLGDLPKYQQPLDTVGFKKVLSSLWNQDTKVVLVFEEELSLEDFAMKDTAGSSLLQLFENTKDRRFFPSVNEPEEAVVMLSKNGFSVKVYNDDVYTNSSEKMFALADFSENKHNDDKREIILLRHNDNISKMFDYLCKQYTNVVLILSGKRNPWIKKSNSHHLVTRHLMAIDDKSSKSAFVLKDNKGKSLIYSGSYPTLVVDNAPVTDLQGNPDVYTDESRDNQLKVTAKFLQSGSTNTLRFNFYRKTFTWELNSVEYENSKGVTSTLKPQQPITAQMGLSYFSEKPVIFVNNNIKLSFNNKFQIQPWMTSSSGAKFSDPQEQNSFFTPPILAGLFVTALMLFIVTWGIVMIMDIKTMDRFDDPKGKTISINVAE